VKTKLTLKFITLCLLPSVFCLPAFAQTTVFTYQGRVTDNGTNFNGAGQFKFALVTSTNASHTATATATISGQFVTLINVSFGGNGYVTTPAVSITGGGGSGATATASVSGGAVTSITVNNPGSAYSSAPTVTIAPPPPNVSYTTFWSNDGTSVNGSEPAAAVGVGVNNGLFTVVLGDTTLANMESMPAFVFTAQPSLQLRIWFNDGLNGSAALSPVQNLTPAPYAVNALFADGLPGLAVKQSTNGAPDLIGGSPANFVAGGVVGATIGGGGATYYFGNHYTNSVTADFGTVSGGIDNTASGGAFVGGGYGNTASDFDAVVGGGFFNTASASAAAVCGGANNIASNSDAVVGGGYYNTAGGAYAAVGGGSGNNANANASTVGGGEANSASGIIATVGGGYGNTASAFAATVSGGENNQASGSWATVAGGNANLAGGQSSFAAGSQAQALHQGAFVWADSQNAPFASTANDEFLIRAQGGVGINTTNPADAALSVNGRLRMNDQNVYFRTGTDTYHGLGFFGSGSANGTFAGANVNGPVLWGNGGGALGIVNGTQAIAVLWTSTSVTVNGTFNNNSDRDAKQDFTSVTPAEILAKVAQLPVCEWSYKTDATTRHIGPVAQDFFSAFNIGTDNKHIAPIDEGGVALAAIQGLNQKLTDELKRRDAENAELKQRLEKLEQVMCQESGGVGSFSAISTLIPSGQ
jgi:hypothetical protein